MKYLKTFENYYDEIKGYMSTNAHKSEFKDGDRVKNINYNEEGKVYDVLIKDNKTLVVVKWDGGQIGKYGEDFQDIKDITKI